jgi:hypothetical protein
MPTMDTRMWIIVAIAVVVILVAGYYLLRPTAETTAPPATTEQPAPAEQPAQPAPSN